MSDRYHVDTAARLIQWSIENFAYSCPSQTPIYLDMGTKSWSFLLEKYEQVCGKVFTPPLRPPTASLFIKHSPKLSGDTGTHLIASFSIRVVSLSGGRKTLYYGEFMDKQLNSEEELVLSLRVPLSGRSIVQVEFLQLKTASPNEGGQSRSIWCEGLKHKDLNVVACPYIGKMLSESIHTDITICASNGTNIGAHRAILAAHSPVFNSMFSHDLKEKILSSINIEDMSIEALRVFLTYMYSNIKYEDFIVHRLDLLRAADKYDVSDLKDACEESLLEDINTNNVLERLQNAFLYRLPRLKDCCICYLVKFGKLFEIREEFDEFIQSGDRELVTEVIREVISVWEYF